MPLVNPLPPNANPDVAELARFFDETLGFCPNSALKRLVGNVASHAAGCRYC